MLFRCCSLVVKLFEQFRHTENCVRISIALMKYVINGKNNLCIPQRSRKTLFQQIERLENCLVV